jgi:hypothetical protein
MPITLEDRARENIDTLLTAAGWSGRCALAGYGKMDSAT